MAKHTTNFDVALRVLAYAAAFLVLAVSKLLGGSWLELIIGLMITDLTYRSLRDDTSKGGLDWLSVFKKIKSLPTPVRFAYAVLLAGAGVTIDVATGEHALGLEFGIYLFFVFFSSLLFGARVTLATCILCCIAVDYCDIQPRYSFIPYSIYDFSQLIIFIVLSIIVLLIPQILEASTELTADKRTWP